MAWDEEWNQPQRWDEFHFFTSNSTPMSEILTFDKAWKLFNVRLHLSTAFLSIEDFTIRLNSIRGSSYNVLFTKQSMSGLTDFVLLFDSVPIGFLSGDQLLFSMSIAVGINTWGLTATGWSVRG